MSLSSPFIARPVATSLMMVGIFLSGILAYFLLPISSLPQVEYPTMQISTFYPGASPEVIVSSVTAPLERQLGQMPGLTQMTSSSANGASLITLQFNLNLPLDIAEQEVQAAINASSNFLPKDIPNPPIYSKVNPADAPIITLALTSKTLPLPVVEDFAESRLVQKISQLSGVGLVQVSGGMRPAIRIQVNTQKLAALNISLEDIHSAISGANANAAKGNLDGPIISYTINSNDQLLTMKDYQDLIIAYRNNAAVRLSQVATIINGAENILQAAWMNKTPAVILNVQRQPGANVIEVVDRIKALLPQLQNTLPAAIEVHVLADRTLTIRSSIAAVKLDLCLAIGLVVLVIFLFLRNLPATFIPSASVPISLVGTFGMMYLLGFSLNNLTLMALTIATGFVVDDAIVMIENITRYIEMGETPMNAAIKGASQISFTILSLTFSLIAVLIPLLFMGDITGRLFREFAITLAVTILISAVVSLTFTPMLCARILKNTHGHEEGRFAQKLAGYLQWLIHRYEYSLTWILARQKQVLWVAFITILFTGFLFYIIPKGFFPTQDTGVIQVVTQGPQASSFSAMADKQQALAAQILHDPAVQNLSSFVGIDGTNTSLNMGRMFITLKPLNERADNSSVIIARLQHALKQFPSLLTFMQPIQDLTVDDRMTRAKYQLSMSGEDNASMIAWTQKLLTELKNIPSITDALSDLQLDGLQTLITINRDVAARFGINTQLIDNTLYDAFGQRLVSTVFTQHNQYHVVMEAAVKNGALNGIYFPSNAGKSVPLSALTSIRSITGPLVINRQDQFPVSTLSFNLAQHASLGDAIDDIDTVTQKMSLPDNVHVQFEGAAKIFQQSLNNEGWLILASILVVYIVLGVLYESYIHPLTILSTLPSAGMGALLALILFGKTLSIVSLIGLILLIGIVMKNAIIMIDFALELERDQNKSAYEAIYTACILRFRPILMTTLASMFGAIPLAISSGMGAELRQPLGIAIFGGLFISQLLTLYTTPVIYLAFDRLATKFKRDARA